MSLDGTERYMVITVSEFATHESARGTPAVAISGV
jgi:hypothetical protein